MFKKGNSKRWKVLSLAVALYLGGGGGDTGAGGEHRRMCPRGGPRGGGGRGRILRCASASAPRMPELEPRPGGEPVA